MHCVTGSAVGAFASHFPARDPGFAVGNRGGTSLVRPPAREASMQGTFGRTLCTAGLGLVAAVMSGCIDMTLPDLSNNNGYPDPTLTPATCSPPAFRPSGAYSPSSGSVRDGTAAIWTLPM